MPPSSDDPTIERPLPSADATLTHAGADGPAAREAPVDFAPPGYEILGELGRGGMGVVYKARQQALHRLVALKVILGAGHAGRDQLARFRAEATTAAQLQHANIVQVFEVGEHHGQPFFSLELVEGGSLADHLKGEPQPPGEAAQLVRTLALAVHHAHERGVVHRDLKPANVLISKDPRPTAGEAKPGGSTVVDGHWSARLKVTDFGLAKQQSSESGLTASGAVLGTPSYMSPEQAAGKGQEVGPRSDVYALGAVLYECLTGRPPFRGPTVLDTVLQVMSDEPVPPSRLQPKVPRDLETICLKCLAKKPGDRYATAADLAADLGRFLNGEPVHARPASPVARAWKWSRRHPALATVGFVFAVPLPVLLGVMVYLWAEGRAARKVAEEERAAAVQSRDEADRERALAQGYLTNAIHTMDKILDRIGDDRMARIPAIQEDRTAILADAVQFYQTLLRLDSADPVVRAQTAGMYARVGRTNLMAGQIARSGESSRTAIELLEALAAEHPDRVEYRAELSKHYVVLGHSRILDGDFADGLRAYEKAAALSEALMAEQPHVLAHRRAAAEARRSLGYFYSTQNPARAEAHFVAAVGLVEKLTDTPDDRALTAHVSAAMGAYLLSQRKLSESEARLRAGLALLAGPLPTRGQGRVSAEIAAVTLRTTLALVCFQTRRPDEGDRLLGEVVAAVESSADLFGQSFPYRMQAITAYQTVAQRRQNARDLPGALAASGKALAQCDALLAEVPALKEYSRGAWFQVIRLRVVLAHAARLISAGRRDEARALVADLDAGPVLTGPLAYNFGCVLATLSESAAPLSREILRRRALAWLQKASATGYPATAAEVEHVREKDADLAVLRGRPDFRAWAAGLGKK
ncbi:MAG TPA: protein kinase [Gemmataceae bacterium]|nr:protein kinase [Gemmataceae bacterium]